MREIGLVCTSEEVLAFLTGGTQVRRLIGLDVNTPPNTEGRISDKGILQFRCPPENMIWRDMFWGNNRPPKSRHCKLIKPPYQVGDRIYVRETWRVNAIGYVYREHHDRKTVEVEYNALGGQSIGDREVYCVTDEELIRAHHYYEKHSANCTSSFSPNFQMPKWAARIWREITSVRVVKEKGKHYWVYNLKEGE